MKRSLQIVGLVSFLALPLAVHAQDDKSVSFGASGGLSLPLGDFADLANSGYTVAGHIFLKPSGMAKLGFRGDVAYDSWGAKGIAGSLADGNRSALTFAANAMFSLGDDAAAMKPYLIGGGGMYRSKASFSVLGFEGSAESTDPGIQVGAGFEFKLSGFSTFVEGKFVNVFGDGGSSNWVPITFGVKF